MDRCLRSLPGALSKDEMASLNHLVLALHRIRSGNNTHFAYTEPFPRPLPFGFALTRPKTKNLPTVEGHCKPRTAGLAARAEITGAKAEGPQIRRRLGRRVLGSAACLIRDRVVCLRRAVAMHDPITFIMPLHAFTRAPRPVVQITHIGCLPLRIGDRDRILRQGSERL